MIANCNYLYGVVLADETKDFGPIGLDGEVVRTIVDGGIGVVASKAAPVDFSAIQPEHTLQYLAQHQRVLEQVMLDATVIPVKFGTYARDDADVTQILRCGARQFAAALQTYADKAEIDLAVSWTDLRSVLAQIATAPAIVAMKADFAAGADVTVEQRVRMGQLAKTLLDQKNQAVAAALVDSLRARWQNIVVNPSRDDSAILNAAVLIDRRDQAQFDQMLEQLNRSYDDRLNFRRVGPLPAYSFATAEVRSVPTSGLDAARLLLGLSESASLADIKGAHRRLLKEVHPDRNSDTDAQGRLQDISAAYELLEKYAMNFKHTFTSDQVSPVIVTVRSLDDLRLESGLAQRRRQSTPAGAQAA